MVSHSRLDLSTRAESRVGQMLRGKWRVDRLIDIGGMGAVYAATHRNGRRAALKVLHPQYALDPEVRKRFLREGYVANKIDHPGALAILDDDVAEDGSPFLVMELLEGESLAGWLKRVGGTLDPVEAIAVAGQVLEVLGLAHQHGIVHRDIKPGNIFVVQSGHAKLLDFGLARVRDGVISLIPTAVGIVMGTPGYMAPEQARGLGDQIDARSDIFAVGAVLFRAISGRPIHAKETPFDTTIAAMREPAPALKAVVPHVDPALAVAVDRALAEHSTSKLAGRPRRRCSRRSALPTSRCAHVAASGAALREPHCDTTTTNRPASWSRSRSVANTTRLWRSSARGHRKPSKLFRFSRPPMKPRRHAARGLG